MDRLLHGEGRDIARLVGEAGRTTDQRQRMALYREADTALIREALCVRLAYNRFQLLVTRGVRTLPMSASCFWFWKDTVLGEA